MDPQTQNPQSFNPQPTPVGQPFGAPASPFGASSPMNQPFGQPAMPQASPFPQSSAPFPPSNSPFGQDSQSLSLQNQMSAPAPMGAVDPKQQILERLKGSVNVLVTVSNNPSVDQLAAIIGFTLVLNKLKKRGTAVFSGQVPSTIEFLQPEKTIEKNTDSLQDFIVALDKSKADKLRYKIEDKYVKIFITPYHTSLTQSDLEFGQGDLNVDVIVALGVDKRDELDQAIMAHGRILHDATVISITKHPGDDIGAINWHVPEASSYSEVLVGLCDMLKSPQTELYDQQIATAFLTGIVAETDRFSNEKTTPGTMTTAAVLMRAGANQQLIANKLEEPEPIPEETSIPQAPLMPMPIEQVSYPDPVISQLGTPPPPAPPINDDGSMQIPHEGSEHDAIHIDEDGELHLSETPPAASSATTNPVSTLPPINMDDSAVNRDDQTLEEIEKAVNSPHLDTSSTEKSGDSSAHLSEAEARSKVEAIEEADTIPGQGDGPTGPIAALNAMPVDLDMGHSDQPAAGPGAASADSTASDTTPPATPPPLTGL